MTDTCNEKKAEQRTIYTKSNVKKQWYENCKWFLFVPSAGSGHITQKIILPKDNILLVHKVMWMWREYNALF